MCDSNRETDDFNISGRTQKQVRRAGQCTCLASLSEGSVWLVCVCHILLILFMMEWAFLFFSQSLTTVVPISLSCCFSRYLITSVVWNRRQNVSASSRILLVWQILLFSLTYGCQCTLLNVCFWVAMQQKWVEQEICDDRCGCTLRACSDWPNCWNVFPHPSHRYLWRWYCQPIRWWKHSTDLLKNIGFFKIAAFYSITSFIGSRLSLSSQTSGFLSTYNIRRTVSKCIPFTLSATTQPHNCVKRWCSETSTCSW